MDKQIKSGKVSKIIIISSIATGITLGGAIYIYKRKRDKKLYKRNSQSNFSITIHLSTDQLYRSDDEELIKELEKNDDDITNDFQDSDEQFTIHSSDEKSFFGNLFDKFVNIFSKRENSLDDTVIITKANEAISPAFDVFDDNTDTVIITKSNENVNINTTPTDSNESIALAGSNESLQNSSHENLGRENTINQLIRPKTMTTNSNIPANTTTNEDVKVLNEVIEQTINLVNSDIGSDTGTVRIKNHKKNFNKTIVINHETTPENLNDMDKLNSGASSKSSNTIKNNSNGASRRSSNNNAGSRRNSDSSNNTRRNSNNSNNEPNTENTTPSAATTATITDHNSGYSFSPINSSDTNARSNNYNSGQRNGNSRDKNTKKNYKGTFEPLSGSESNTILMKREGLESSQNDFSYEYSTIRAKPKPSRKLPPMPGTNVSTESIETGDEGDVEDDSEQEERSPSKKSGPGDTNSNDDGSEPKKSGLTSRKRNETITSFNVNDFIESENEYVAPTTPKLGFSDLPKSSKTSGPSNKTPKTDNDSINPLSIDINKLLMPQNFEFSDEEDSAASGINTINSKSLHRSSSVSSAFSFKSARSTWADNHSVTEDNLFPTEVSNKEPAPVGDENWEINSVSSSNTSGFYSAQEDFDSQME